MARTRIKNLVAAAAMAITAGGLSAESASASTSPFRIVPGPQPGNARLQSSSAISTTDVWAVGSFQGPSDLAPSQTLAEHWNGRAWTVVATPNPASGSRLDGVSAVSSTDVWAIGNTGSSFHGHPTSTFIEHWNGTRWSFVASPNPDPSLIPILTSVRAISTTNVYAVGYEAGTSVGCNSYIPFVEHWNGAGWSIISTAASCGTTLQGVSSSSASDVWIVGGQSGPQTGAGFAEHFNGRTWTATPFPLYVNASAVVSVSPSNAWAVGGAIAHWNGTTWTVVQDYLHTPGGLSAITKVSATDLWAVGEKAGPGTAIYGFTTQTFAEHFNGTAWSVVPTPDAPNPSGPGDFLSGVSSAGNHVYSVGESSPTSFTGNSLILENDNG